MTQFFFLCIVVFVQFFLGNVFDTAFKKCENIFGTNIEFFVPASRTCFFDRVLDLEI